MRVPPRSPLRLLLAILSVCLLLDTARANPSVPTFDPTDTRPMPTVSLLTMGPGDQAFFKFGHNAIRVRYPGNQGDYVYNFGTFAFDSPTLILDFLTGKFRYWLSVQTFQSTLRHYSQANRSVYEQELNLAGYQARHLADVLEINARPENKYYEYDYYRDNCSTRIRDALDANLGGALYKRFQSPGQMTLREHTLRATADSFWVYAGLDIAMGSYIDQPETRWGEMFLPEKLMQGVQSVVFNGPHGSSSLVKEKRTLYEAVGRAGIRAKPPERTFGFLQGGLAFGGLMAFLGWENYRRRKRWARAVIAIVTGSFGLVVGVLGTLFVALWALTNHEVAYHNENILQCAPWALALPLFAVGMGRGRPHATSWAQRLTLAGLGFAVLGLLLKVFPFMMQDNARIMAALIPSWAGLSIATALVKRRIEEDLRRGALRDLAPGRDEPVTREPVAHEPKTEATVVEHPEPREA